MTFYKDEKFIKDIRYLEDEIYKLLKNFSHLTSPLHYQGLQSNFWSPDADIYETEHLLVVVVDLSGVSKDDVKITYYDNKIRISGFRNIVVNPDKVNTYYKIEINSGQFEKLIILPDVPIKVEPKVSLTQGLLKIVFPKEEEKIIKKVKIDIE